MSEIIAAVIVRIGAALLSYATAAAAKRRDEAISARETEARVARVKAALNSTLDGKPATKEQRVELNQAFRDLVRGSSSDGL